VASRTHFVPAPEGPPRIIQNRNALLWLYPGALGVKTGFTSAAGFCMAAAADREDESLVAVVLGAPGEAFSDAAALLNFGFAAFERRTLVEPAEALGSVEIDGRQVAVAAGRGLDALVPVEAVIGRELVLDPRVRYPPGLGQPVGSVVVSRSGGPVLGEVPLLVTGVPPPEPLADDESWWSRALGAVLDAGAGLLEALVTSA
jgi:D-alanyl-D-alanine carboxypeptidase (penicillin-binding protein 5/6)